MSGRNEIDRDNEKMGVYVTSDWTPVEDSRRNPFNEMMAAYKQPFSFPGCLTVLFMGAVIVGFCALLYFGWLFMLDLPPFGYVSTPIAEWTVIP